MAGDEDPDVERVARRMIDRHGREAATMAERRARELLVEGNRFAHDLWREVADAVRRRQGDRA